MVARTTRIGFVSLLAHERISIPENLLTSWTFSYPASRVSPGRPHGHRSNGRNQGRERRSQLASPAQEKLDHDAAAHLHDREANRDRLVKVH